jgi:DNA polymerase-3 subunit alpha
LKANYPVEFMAGVLSYEISNPDKIANFVSECFEMGIECCRRTSTSRL